MNTKRQVGIYTEHVNNIQHSCGCRREHVTLYQIPLAEIRKQRLKECPKCSLRKLLEAER